MVKVSLSSDPIPSTKVYSYFSSESESLLANNATGNPSGIFSLKDTLKILNGSWGPFLIVSLSYLLTTVPTVTSPLILVAI